MKKLFLLLFGLVAASYAFAVTPADPTNVTWFDCGDESGHSYLTFTLPTVDVEGNPLDIEMMGYRIYTDDDQIFTFNSALYDNIWGSTTDIYYYSWEAGSDLQSGGVFFYRTNADGFERFFNNRIGVQVFYVNDDFSIGGVSNIVYTELEAPAALPKPKNPVVSDWIDSNPVIWPDGSFSVSSQVMLECGIDWMQNPVADDYPGDKAVFDAMDQGITLEYTILDGDKISYSIFTDNDKLFVLTPEMYPELFEEIYPGLQDATRIPYAFEGGNIEYWFVHFPQLTNNVGVLQENGIEAEPFFTWRIGVQSYYTVKDQTSSSDIVYMEIFPQLKEADEVTPTSFLADWSCDAENTFMVDGFKAYHLYVINTATQDTLVFNNINPTNYYVGEWGNEEALPGSIFRVEGLTPGATYQYYVVSEGSYHTYQSVVREVTLPGGGHGYELGDVNHDEAVNISDVTALIDYLLGSGSVCEICANVNGDEGINISDVTALIDKLLSNN